MQAASVVEPSDGPYLSNNGGKSALISWLTTTDHKRIGVLYLISILVFFAIGVLLGFIMRLELISPGATVIDADTYNRVFSLHGVVMVFLFIIPGIQAVFGNFLLPIMIGAKDVSFPRLNLLTWYLFIAGALIAILSVFDVQGMVYDATGHRYWFLPGGGASDSGWTFYAPYSIGTETNVTWTVFAAFILGFSSILTGINFITTTHQLRAPGMGFFDMPLFVWASYATSWIAVLATPVIAITLVLVVMERTLGIGIFDASMGGDPILFQHLFWIYSHPAVYVMVLPAMGVVSEIITVFSQRVIFGYKGIAFSSLAIAFVGYLVWGHHMFTSGISDESRYIFSLLTFIVAVPSGIKVVNWVATLYKGSISLDSPMLITIFFIVTFSIGGVTGLVVGAVGPDIHLHDSFYVVAHFHYVMFGGLGFMFFAAIHMWFPKMFGVMYNEGIAKISAWFVMIGFQVLYFPMFILGYYGMPRRYFDYLPEFAGWNFVSTVGAWILVAGLILMFSNLIRGLYTGPKAPRNPWGGVTLEWQLSSPPAKENFEEIPRIIAGPYDYDEVVKKP